MSGDLSTAGEYPSGGDGDPFEALGHPTRRRLVELLAEEDQSVRELADQLPISRPAVSRHLRLLKEAGLVSDQPLGTRRVYALNDDGIDALRLYLENVWGTAMARFRLRAENTTERTGDGATTEDPR